jgi:formiminoglutamase
VDTKYPFLISIPHGGIEVPHEVAGRMLLSRKEILWYCDPETRTLFDFRGSVEALIDTRISRMVVDLNRPPLPLPPRDPDGIIKVLTIDGRDVYRTGRLPDTNLIHRLLLKWYFPYHQRIDELLDQYPVRIAFDCHSMLPYGSMEQKDAGKKRPLICLGNNGDRRGRPKKGGLTTCPMEWISQLADAFREIFPYDGDVAINNPFSGGFISNAHYWRKGIPWIQIEINRSLYEPEHSSGRTTTGTEERIEALQKSIQKVLTGFWDNIAAGDSVGDE